MKTHLSILCLRGVARGGITVAVIAAFLWVRGYWCSDSVGILSLREESLSRRVLTLQSSRGRLHVEWSTVWLGDRVTFLRERAHYTAYGLRNDRIVRWTRNKPCDLPQSDYGRAKFGRWGFLWDRSVQKSRFGQVFETTCFMVPYWWVTLLAGLVPAARLALRTRLLLRSRLLNAQGRCGHCGYDLRATPARCPECGTELAALAPTDPTSMSPDELSLSKSAPAGPPTQASPPARAA